MAESQPSGNTPGEHPPGQPVELDSSLEPAALAQLVQQRPDLGPAIQTHPNCYPDLRDWISQQAPAQGSASVEQFTEGAKKAAAGAKTFFGLGADLPLPERPERPCNPAAAGTTPMTRD